MLESLALTLSYIVVQICSTTCVASFIEMVPHILSSSHVPLACMREANSPRGTRRCSSLAAAVNLLRSASVTSPSRSLSNSSSTPGWYRLHASSGGNRRLVTSASTRWSRWLLLPLWFVFRSDATSISSNASAAPPWFTEFAPMWFATAAEEDEYLGTNEPRSRSNSAVTNADAIP